MSIGLGRSIFLCPNDNPLDHFDTKSYSEQLFFRQFGREMRSFAGKLKKLKMNKNFLVLLILATRNFSSVFWVFRRKNALFAKTLWRKVVWNTILHRSGHVDYHMDTKIGLAKVQWTYTVDLKKSIQKSIVRHFSHILWVFPELLSPVTTAYLKIFFINFFYGDLAKNFGIAHILKVYNKNSFAWVFHNYSIYYINM